MLEIVVIAVFSGRSAFVIFVIVVVEIHRRSTRRRTRSTTRSPMARPWRRPCSTAFLKWNPTRMRESPFSSAASVKLLYERSSGEASAHVEPAGSVRLQVLKTTRSVEDAARTTCRKRVAWARKLLGDIAMLEDRPSDAAREFNAALVVLERHACPTIEWQILRGAAAAAGAIEGDEARRARLARARAVVQSLADGIPEAERRDVFLRSPAVRALQ
jgi:hypothetical protein